jgi:chemotaxis-related protein WspD
MSAGNSLPSLPPPSSSPPPGRNGASPAGKAIESAPTRAPDAHEFFNRPPPPDYLAEWSSRLAQPEHGSDEDLQSVVIYRLGSEWLAMNTTRLAEITDPHPVHSIPHRSNAVLRGLVNIRGQLRLCVSLHGLLGVGPAPPDPSAAARVGLPGSPGHTSYARMAILQLDGEQWVFVADEIVGVHRLSVSQFRKVPSTHPQGTSHTQAVFDWKGHTVGYLDVERLVASLRSHCQ